MSYFSRSGNEILRAGVPIAEVIGSGRVLTTIRLTEKTKAKLRVLLEEDNVEFVQSKGIPRELDAGQRLAALMVERNRNK